MENDDFYSEDIEVDNEENVYAGFDPDANKYNEFSLDTPDLDETPLPAYMQQLFPNKKRNAVDHEDGGRGTWDSQFEYLLSCIGYAIGLGNLWRFPNKVYNGGGGAFLLPYFIFCLIVGFPILMLEMGLGQFCGQSGTRAFECVPLLFGQGWIIWIVCFCVTLGYCIVISYCFIYFFLSFKSILPWSVCTNSFNTPFCINVSAQVGNLTNNSYVSSSIEFYNYYITGSQKPDSSFYLITEPLGKPLLPTCLCLIVVLTFTAIVLMFGVKVSGKVIYVTVIFPYIALVQFIILGCTLPGALKGIKFYLYPDPIKLLDPLVILSALEQLFFSCGIAVGGLITMSSFNRFRDPIYRNALFVILTDFFTSFISGFATFPVLGYMSYRSGKEIKDLIPSGSGLFFITFPEALSTLSNANLWSIFFMLMAIMLGIDSLFVLIEAFIMGIADCFPVLHSQRNRVILTISVCIVVFISCLIFVTPGGGNWLNLFDSRIAPFILLFSAILEILTICWIYGFKQLIVDYEMMTGKKINIYFLIVASTFLPISIGAVLVLGALNTSPIVIQGNSFPMWTQTLAWISIIVILSPLPIGAIYTLITYRIKFPEMNIYSYLKECISPPPIWGPKLKRYWVTADIYSKKLIKYKDDPKFISLIRKSENMDKLLYKAEKRIRDTSA